MQSLSEKYLAVRRRTESLAAGLSAEDLMIQAYAYASPGKWHLGHTTWFFDTFVLQAFDSGWRTPDPQWGVLFNSYYEGVGKRVARHARGTLSRPSLQQVRDWRARVDDAMVRLLEERGDRISGRVLLGLNHEEQHQELFLTDLQANLHANPTLPAWQEHAVPSAEATQATWVRFPESTATIGYRGGGFCFDNELGVHDVLLRSYDLRSTCITQREVLEFMKAGGYRDHRLWLSDGMAWVREHGIHAPRYWQEGAHGWERYTLYGTQPIDPNRPATHLSAFEADAICRFFGWRLPTEFEWESAARSLGPPGGRWLGDGLVLPNVGTGPLRGLWGEGWEWTRSAYLPYPGYRTLPGALGEYNGKFMSSQWVLRGGSAATPTGHIRPSYRNFFYPQERWQFTAIRPARDPE